MGVELQRSRKQNLWSMGGLNDEGWGVSWDMEAGTGFILDGKNTPEVVVDWKRFRVQNDIKCAVHEPLCKRETFHYTSADTALCECGSRSSSSLDCWESRYLF